MRAFWGIATALWLALPGPSAAQTLAELTLGQPIPEGLPLPSLTQTQAPFTRNDWTAWDNRTVSAISDSETGEVHFIELRPTGPGPIATGLTDFTFGETTQADLHRRFGSEGIVFEAVGRAGVFGEVAAYFTSYEIDGHGAVVSFVTIEPLADASDGSEAQSRLDSIVLAQDAYLNQVWGLNRGRLPGYAPIEDPFETTE